MNMFCMITLRVAIEILYSEHSIIYSWLSSVYFLTLFAPPPPPNSLGKKITLGETSYITAANEIGLQKM